MRRSAVPDQKGHSLPRARYPANFLAKLDSRPRIPFDVHQHQIVKVWLPASAGFFGVPNRIHHITLLLENRRPHLLVTRVVADKENLPFSLR